MNQPADIWKKYRESSGVAPTMTFSFVGLTNGQNDMFSPSVFSGNIAGSVQLVFCPDNI